MAVAPQISANYANVSPANCELPGICELSDRSTWSVRANYPKFLKNPRELRINGIRELTGVRIIGTLLYCTKIIARPSVCLSVRG